MLTLRDRYPAGVWALIRARSPHISGTWRFEDVAIALGALAALEPLDSLSSLAFAAAAELPRMCAALGAHSNSDSIADMADCWKTGAVSPGAPDGKAAAVEIEQGRQALWALLLPYLSIQLCGHVGHLRFTSLPGLQALHRLHATRRPRGGAFDWRAWRAAAW